MNIAAMLQVVSAMEAIGVMELLTKFNSKPKNPKVHCHSVHLAQSGSTSRMCAAEFLCQYPTSLALGLSAHYGRRYVCRHCAGCARGSHKVACSPVKKSKEA